MDITPKLTESLSDRKFRIMTRLNEQLPYTLTGLKQQLAALCGEDGYSVTLDSANYSIGVLVALTAKSAFTDVDALLRRMTPANLVISLALKYNQHLTLSAFTHEHLNTYTYDQLRNEVI